MISENFLDKDFMKDKEKMMKRMGMIMEELNYYHKITYDYKKNEYKRERDGNRYLSEDYYSLKNGKISRDRYILNKLNIYYEEFKFYENPLKYSRLISLSIRIYEFYKNYPLYKFILRIDDLFRLKNIDKIININDYLK